SSANRYEAPHIRSSCCDSSHKSKKPNPPAVKGRSDRRRLAEVRLWHASDMPMVASDVGCRLVTTVVDSMYGLAVRCKRFSRRSWLKLVGDAGSALRS